MLLKTKTDSLLYCFGFDCYCHRLYTVKILKNLSVQCEISLLWYNVPNPLRYSCVTAHSRKEFGVCRIFSSFCLWPFDICEPSVSYNCVVVDSRQHVPTYSRRTTCSTKDDDKAADDVAYLSSARRCRTRSHSRQTTLSRLLFSCLTCVLLPINQLNATLSNEPNSSVYHSESPVS